MWCGERISTIFSHHHGHEAVKYYLDPDGSLPLWQRTFILELLIFTMDHNYFCFGGNLYLQLWCSHGHEVRAHYGNFIYGLVGGRHHLRGTCQANCSYGKDILTMSSSGGYGLRKKISNEYDVSHKFINLGDFNIQARGNKLITTTILRKQK